MSIGKRISEAIDKMDASDPEGVLFAVCATLDATAASEFGRGGTSYKRFVSENLDLITGVAFGGRRILKMRLGFDHPEMKKSPDCAYTIEEILYHAVRCGLYHEERLPDNLQFTNEGQILSKMGHLCCRRL